VTDAGRITPFVATVAAALVLVVGLVVDGCGWLGALERANAIAREAARVGGQQVDRDVLAVDGRLAVDERRARAAIDAYLAAAECGAGSGMVIEADAVSTTIRVTCALAYRPLVLSFTGLDGSAEGQGAARLVSSSDQ
jgi:hypothetical protein